MKSQAPCDSITEWIKDAKMRASEGNLSAMIYQAGKKHFGCRQQNWWSRMCSRIMMPASNVPMQRLRQNLMPKLMCNINGRARLDSVHSRIASPRGDNWNSLRSKTHSAWWPKEIVAGMAASQAWWKSSVPTQARGDPLADPSPTTSIKNFCLNAMMNRCWLSQARYDR